MRQDFYRHWGQGRHRQDGNPSKLYCWLPVALCLHGLTLAAMFAFLLSACGSSSSPWGYMWTDMTHLETLSWNESNGQLSGQYSGISSPQVSFPADPTLETYSAAYGGTLKGQTVNITIGTGLLSQHLTGTRSSDGNMLTLTLLDPTSGKAVQQRWVAVSREQQSQLVSAFNAYQTARAWLALVQQERQRENDWHDPNANALATTQRALQQQQALVEQMQQASEMQARCSLAAAYRPLDSSWFTLPFPASSDGLLSALAHFQQAWRDAEQSNIAHLAGLALPWLLSSANERRGIAGPSALASHLQESYRTDWQMMRQDQQESQQLDQLVTRFAQGCPPMPA